MISIDRDQIWLIISCAFNSIFHTAAEALPHLKMEIGHSHNDSFPFRAYAEFHSSGGVVVLSFDVQTTSTHVRTFADLSLESGSVIKQLVSYSEVLAIFNCDTLLSHAIDFGNQCRDCSGDIVAALIDGRKAD